MTSMVSVYGADGEVLGEAHPATARRALDDGRAEIRSRDPFSIRLLAGASIQWAARKGGPMGNISWTDYFQTEKDVWVRNISNRQVSLSFEVSSGHYASELIPLIAEPVHLTARVPFAVIKNSMDFRKQLDRTPPHLELLDEAGLKAFYERKARREGTDVVTAKARSQAAVAAAREKKKDAVPTHKVVNGKIVFTPPKSLLELQGVVEPHMGVADHLANRLSGDPIPADLRRGTDASLGAAPAQGGYAGEGEGPNLGMEAISPRVVDLCYQASMQLDPKDRMQAPELQRRLEECGQLNLDSLSYIESKVPYASVKRWARALAAEMQPTIDDVSGASAEGAAAQSV